MSAKIALRQACSEHAQETNHNYRERGAGNTSHESQGDALGQSLTNEPRTACADRDTDRDFPLSRGCSCQQETRDVGTRKKQDDTDGNRQDHQRRTHWRNHLVTNPKEIKPGPVEGCCVLASRTYLRQYRADLRHGCVTSAAFRNSCDRHADVLTAPTCRADERNPERALRIRKLEALSHDSDDGVSPSVEREHSTDDVGLRPEMSQPCGVAQDHNSVGPCRRLLLVEDATDDRTRTQHGKHRR